MPRGLNGGSGLSVTSPARAAKSSDTATATVPRPTLAQEIRRNQLLVHQCPPIQRLSLCISSTLSSPTPTRRATSPAVSKTTPVLRKSMEAISTNSSARENSRLALSIFPSSCVQTATTSVQKYNKSQNKSCHDVQLSNNKSTAVNCVFMAK